MKTKNYICGLAIAAATLALGSCTAEVDLPEAHESSLELEVSDSSRAPIFDQKLPDGSFFSMGCVNLTDPTKYELRNVEYSNGQAQILGAPVMLRNDSVYQVFALYPALKDFESLKEGGLEISAWDNIDYMAAQSNVLRYDYSRANLVFEHLLSMVRINIKKSDFVTEDYQLNFIGISDVDFAGWYDFKERGFTKTYGTDIDLEFNDLLQSDKYVTRDVMVIPAENGNMSLFILINNDKVLTISFDHKPFVAGQILNINLTVSADELKIENQEIKPWITDEEYDINTSIAAAGKAVNLGLSKLWADRNVGAYGSNEYGQYYFWNSKVSELWGEEWQEPTPEDFEELMSKCTWKWVTKGTVNGYEVSGNGNSIFLPAAGWIEEGLVGRTTNDKDIDINVQVKDNYNDINFIGLYMSTDPEAALRFSSQGSNIVNPGEGLILRSIRPVKVNK